MSRGKHNNDVEERRLMSRISILLNRKQLKLLEGLVKEGAFKSVEEAARGVLDRYSEVRKLVKDYFRRSDERKV